MGTTFPRKWVSSALAALVLGVALCAPAARADDSLYQALGALPGISAIVDDLLVSTDVDPRLKPFFEGVSHKRLRQKLIEQFCSLSGGPCQYTGRTMKESHQGLGIDQAAFNALVEDLQSAMDRQHVSYHAQNRLLALLAPMSHDVIEK